MFLDKLFKRNKTENTEAVAPQQPVAEQPVTSTEQAPNTTLLNIPTQPSIAQPEPIVQPTIESAPVEPTPVIPPTVDTSQPANTPDVQSAPIVNEPIVQPQSQPEVPVFDTPEQTQTPVQSMPSLNGSEEPQNQDPNQPQNPAL